MLCPLLFFRFLHFLMEALGARGAHGGAGSTDSPPRHDSTLHTKVSEGHCFAGEGDRRGMFPLPWVPCTRVRASAILSYYPVLVGRRRTLVGV